MSMKLEIDCLVLDGVTLPAHKQAELQTTVEMELTRLLAEGGLQPGLASNGQVEAIDGGEISLSTGSDAAHLGRQIAQAVYRGIGR